MYYTYFLVNSYRGKWMTVLAKHCCCLIIYNEIYMRVWKGVLWLSFCWFCCGVFLHWPNKQTKTSLNEEWVSLSPFYTHKHISHRRSDRLAPYLAKLTMSAMSQFKCKITQRQTRGTNTWLLTCDCHFFRFLFKKTNN